MAVSEFLIVSLLGSLVTIIPSFILLNYYRLTKIIDYLLFGGFFIIATIYGIIDVFLFNYNYLILYQLRHFFSTLAYLLLFIHAQRVKNRKGRTISFYIAIFWFFQICFLILFWKIIEQPEFILLNGIKIVHSVVLTPSYPKGAGVYINDFLFFSTEFRLFSTAFWLFCLVYLWWAYYKIDLVITDKRTVLAKRLWLVALSSYLVYLIPTVISLNNFIMPFGFILVAIIILLSVSIFMPEAFMISHNQFTNIYQLRSIIDNVKRDKYRRIYSGDLLINYLNRLQVDFIEKEKIIRRQSDVLVESQKHEAMSRLAGGIAHDFNNFLMGISGYIELVEAEITKTKNTTIYFNEINEIINRASSVLKQILLYSKSQIINPVTFDINLQIESMKNIINILNNKNVVIEYNLDYSNNYYIQFDITQFHQIIMNLVSNSLDALDSGGLITIKTEYQSKISKNIGIDTTFLNDKFEYIILHIIDTGKGILEKHLGMIFDPYFTTKKKGTGLGLSIVNNLINQNNGVITCESKENRGTKFSIVLPLQQPTLVDDTHNIENEYEYHFDNKTILLVEDDNKILSIVSKTLTKFGYKVLEATNGKEALETETNYPNKIHIVISDIKMPGMSGVTLCKQLLKSRTDLKIIFISGFTEEKIDPRIIKNKFSYLQKPFKLSDLMNEIKLLMISK